MVSSILPPAFQKENMERKETQRSILHDGKKRNTKNRLAGAEIHLKKKRWHEKKSTEPSCR